ncbi:3-polyprenyl-4-hydroxybenzoate carboxy-lyase UbiX [Thioalkalivibrio nitratireducens DSM 14787]|uniref:Flavin prenyltransferase UbiX n=1 Tax=Thioalkalivibrio nitratireducens (strain DSM 14787 / UNIQEM 213 / ALEN2) TaxID=1255043 RepID=L0DZ18_THIND|nr:flavin prenyltransferase UbiX [Thioalkalivibrio nitratireducens]AGA34293.1 3-polyprenyl-4-hydroxybenzoate carboxy-lyase UbiX [Thioalkalivibrio nitratireducens DSM 14787]
MAADDLALALTGASGAQYGIRLLECLVQSGAAIHLMLSRPAQVVLGLETDLSVPGRPAEIARFFADRFGASEGQIRCYGPEQWTAPVASGSAVPRAMVICPCSTATLSAVATGASRSLIERAADVVLKERRPLVLVVRETPFSEVHLRNMLQLARMGAVIMPANPAFYHRPQTLGDLVDFMVARILDHLDVAHDLVPRWGGPTPAGEDT